MALSVVKSLSQSQTANLMSGKIEECTLYVHFSSFKDGNGTKMYSFLPFVLLTHLLTVSYPGGQLVLDGSESEEKGNQW